MTESKVRIAVIGAGSWSSRVLIPQVLSHPGAELVALCTRTEESLRRAGAQFGVQRLYRDYEELLSREELDAVCIGSTHNLHFEMARAALERGLHTFCEKPLGMNSEQTGRLAQLARSTGLKTMVSFTNRWVPEALYARKLIAEGYCGEAFHYNVCHMASYGRPGGAWMWRADPDLGGGVLYDLGCHNLDLALWLNGPITAVCADLRNTSPERRRGEQWLPTPTDDSDVFLAKFANGCQGVFHISWTALDTRGTRHEIAGREGMLCLSLFHDVWLNSLEGCRAEDPGLRPLHVPEEIQSSIPRKVQTEEDREAARQAFLFAYPSLVRAFIDSILQDTPASPSFAEGHAVQKVMDAILTSHRERRWVEVEAD